MALSVPRLLPTKTYPFSDVRHMLSSLEVQSGVVANEFAVTQDTGANMNSKVAIGNSGAWVFGLDTTRQGAYHVYNDAAVTLAHTGANATNPRIDQVVLRVYDSSVIGGGVDQASLEIIAGTATAGATLDNRNGAADLTALSAPKTLIRLADVLIPAASSAVTNANIRDRRPWAKGAYWVAEGTVSGDYTTTSASLVTTGLTGYQARIECSGAPVEISFSGRAWNTTAGAIVTLAIQQDGVALRQVRVTSPAAAETDNFMMQALFSPTAGSRLFSIAFAAVGGGTATIQNSSSTGPEMTVREVLRPAANNGTA